MLDNHRTAHNIAESVVHFMDAMLAKVNPPSPAAVGNSGIDEAIMRVAQQNIPQAVAEPVRQAVQQVVVEPVVQAAQAVAEPVMQHAV